MENVSSPLWPDGLPFRRNVSLASEFGRIFPFDEANDSIPSPRMFQKKEKNAENSSWMNTADPKQKRKIVNVRKNKRMRPPRLEQMEQARREDETGGRAGTFFDEDVCLPVPR